MGGDLLGPKGQSQKARRERTTAICWNEAMRVKRELELNANNTKALESYELNSFQMSLEWTVEDGFQSMSESLCKALWKLLLFRRLAGHLPNLTEITAVRRLTTLMERKIIETYNYRREMEEWAESAGLEYEAALAKTIQHSQNEELKALNGLIGQRLHMGGVFKGATPLRSEQIRVGVSFRPDSKGKAHAEHDLPGIQAIKKIADIGKYIRFNVIPVPLPPGSSGSDTPDRQEPPENLYNIDILYIPGGPSANDTQVGTTNEEIEFQKATKGYALKEHQSRSLYELQLIKIARRRGIPILAICAGSWRLLEAFGGQVRTLPDGIRERHRNLAQMWTTTHGVSIEARTLLRDILQIPRLAETNTTHWAVADTTCRGELVAKGTNRPLEGLQISALATGKGLPSTVEAFETIHGAMTMGIQWHPESNLPGMPGRGADSGQDTASDRLFKAFAMAGETKSKQKLVIAEIHVRRLMVILGMRTPAHAEQVWQEIYDFYGRQPTQGDIDDYLKSFNLSYS